MSATLNILNNFEVTIDGVSSTGKQGEADDGFSTEFPVTITGNMHKVAGTLATAAVKTVWDDDDDVPTDFVYLYLWADQDLYLQLIGSGTNVILKALALTPFTLSVDSLLAAANTTPITGVSEPSLTDIDSVVLGNYSGNSARYLFMVAE